MKSTVYLTGHPSAKTKRRMIDLLAPSRGDVVATTTCSSSRPGSRQSSRPNSRSSSYSDLTVLEEGALGETGSIREYRGALRDDEGTERATDDGENDSILGGSALGGSVLEVGVSVGVGGNF